MDYLNKWSSHSIKLPNRAKSWPLESLYAFADSSQYYVGLWIVTQSSYPFGEAIRPYSWRPTFPSGSCLSRRGLFLISDRFQNCYSFSVRTDCGFSDCFVGVSCDMWDYLVVFCCDMCDCWTSVSWDVCMAVCLVCVVTCDCLVGVCCDMCEFWLSICGVLLRASFLKFQ